MAPLPSSTSPSAQDARTKFVVSGMALMFVVSWFMALGRNIHEKFWDKKYNMENIYNRDPVPEPELYNSTFPFELAESYFSNRRYLYFLPHVVGAIFWWNLYFLQLIPQIRHKYKAFHRYLGRFLMATALIQTTSGVGLAITSHSSIIKIVSIVLAIATFYCIYYAWKYAYNRDIPMHKFWVYRLVGYLQVIALQRFWMLVLIISHQMGFHGLYPPVANDAPEEVGNQLVRSIFDDSFVLSILTGFLVTEWYLSGMMDMMKAPETSAAYRKEYPSSSSANHPEGRPLL